MQKCTLIPSAKYTKTGIKKKLTERPNAVSNKQEASSGILVLGNAKRRNEYRHVISAVYSCCSVQIQGSVI